MSNWTRRDIPPFCERLIGFSIPQENQILIISYEGTHIIRLGSTISIDHDYNYREYDIYNPDTGIANYLSTEYRILGLHGGEPLVHSPYGDSLALDSQSETLTVSQKDASQQTIRYENFSGGWAVATFSTDGNWIALACPYDFDFLLLQREQAKPSEFQGL